MREKWKVFLEKKKGRGLKNRNQRGVWAEARERNTGPAIEDLVSWV